jgi:hypothetical protein
MKKILASIAIIAFAITSFAQEELELHYKMKVKATDKAYKKVVKQLNGGTMDFYLTKTKFRMDIGFKKQMVTTTVIDMDKDSMVMMITSEELGNSAFTGNFKDAASSDKDENSNEKEVKTGETKKINGYECVKTVVKDGDKTTEIWSTKDIQNPNEEKGIVEGSNSVPVQFIVIEEGMTTAYTLKKTSYTADESLFDLTIPAGYKINQLTLTK